MIKKASIALLCALTFVTGANSQCPPTPATTPLTVNDETTDVQSGRQLTSGSGSTIDTTTPGQIKVDVNLPNSGVTPGSYTDANISVNAQGIVTSASNGSGGGGTTNARTAGNLPATVPNVIVPANGLIQPLPADNTLAIGTSGTEYTVPTVSSNALGICAGPDQNIWFTENNQNKIASITPIGTFVEYTIPTTASAPWGICAGPDGNLWFTENSGNKIGKITTSGTITEYSISTSNSQPTGICAGPDGNVWFTENNGNKIGKITTSGTITEYTVTTSSSQPRNICAGADGNLWFVETAGNKVASITPAGTITEYTVPTGSASPYNICTGPDGNLWFTESAVNKVGKVTTLGTFTEYTVPTSSTTPYGICAGPDGRLWLSEYATDKIAAITTNGAIVEYALPTSGAGASYICVGPDGNLWLTEQSISKVATWQYMVAGTTPVLNAITAGNGLSIARSAGGLTISRDSANSSSARRYVMLAPLGPGSNAIQVWGCGVLVTRGTRLNSVIQNNRLIVPLQAPTSNNNEFVIVHTQTLSDTLSLGPTCWWVVSPDVLTNVRLWVGIVNPDPHTTDTPFKSIAFRFSPTSAGDTHLMAYTGDDTGGGGIHGTVVDTGVTPAVNTPLLLYIDCSSGSSAKFYVDGVLKATITTTLPGSASTMLPLFSETNLTAGQSVRPGIGSMYTEMY